MRATIGPAMSQPSPLRLTAKQMGYLASLIAADSSFAELVRSHPNIQLGHAGITLDRTDAEVLSDHFVERLARVGFDVSYEPNEEGALLESLIDELFPLIAE
jgi:hypothetical protein